MSRTLRVCMAQLNLWVGDVAGNVDKIVGAALEARDTHNADVVVFPELAVLGYPPDDLLLRRGLPGKVKEGLTRIRKEVSGIVVIVGYPEYTDTGIYNAAAVYIGDRRIAHYRKRKLPNYGVFDEERHFAQGEKTCVFELAGLSVGLTICEDIWEPGPAADVARAGASLLININASPFHETKHAERNRILAERAQETGLSIVYVNCVGGQDELVFDGDSMAARFDGQIIARAPTFEEGVFPADVPIDHVANAKPATKTDKPVEELVWQALTMAIADYIQRNRFDGVLIGLSGGIDSSLVLALAADALGAERVWCVAMPSRYTAQLSKDEAAAQAARLGARFTELPIEPMVDAFTGALSESFAGCEADVTEENLQSRIRGTLLMALSNKFRHLVLATGNKSELATGYATLYGDMAGGFAPLKDVYKTMVYRLANWRNAQADGDPVIPQAVIDRPPSAELRADQVDSDSLPPYAVLDGIIRAYVEDHATLAEIAAQGFDADLVRRVARMIRHNEYKRRQAPPGPKVTARAFGRDRRYPITAVYDDI